MEWKKGEGSWNRTADWLRPALVFFKELKTRKFSKADKPAR